MYFQFIFSYLFAFNCLYLILANESYHFENGTHLRIKRYSVKGGVKRPQHPIQQEEIDDEIPDEDDMEIDVDDPDQDLDSDPDTDFDSDSPVKTNRSITVANCGRTSFYAIDRIVGGRPAMSGQFPWQVFLRITTRQGDMVCGGSILNERWILTAAHCITTEYSGDYSVSAIEVVAGSLSRGGLGDSKRQSRHADCAFKHPGWKGSSAAFANDIALIRLPKNNPLKLSYKRGTTVNGICLPARRDPPFEYMGRARVAGWGLTQDRGSLARTLQYTDVNIISDSKCRRYPFPVKIIGSMLCQGVDKTAPCQGDSGGPLIIQQGNKFVQIGLVSFGPGICNNGRIPNTVFTQVSYFLKWIEETIHTYDNKKRCH